MKNALTKSKLKRGMNHGADYTPYFSANRYNSIGTTSIIVDWKHGRSVHCMSQAEGKFYYSMRWNDSVADIREQYPLNRTVSEIVAESLGLAHPYAKTDCCMTTDFLVTEADGDYHAYAVKINRNSLSILEKRFIIIEAAYWNRLGIRFDVVYGDDISDKFVNNIRAVVEYYDPKYVTDLCSSIKHNIAVKKYWFDMLNDEIRKDRLMKIYYEGGFGSEKH